MEYTVNLDEIKRLRKNQNISLQTAAIAIGLKSADQYYRRENGEYNFAAVELPALAKLLGASITDFFTSNVEKNLK